MTLAEARAEPDLYDIPAEVAFSESRADDAAPAAGETAPSIAAAPEPAAPEPPVETGDTMTAQSDAAPEPPPEAEPETTPATLVSFGDEPVEMRQNPPATPFRITEEAMLAVEIGDLVEPELGWLSSIPVWAPWAPSISSPSRPKPNRLRPNRPRSNTQPRRGAIPTAFAVAPETVETLGGGEVEDVEEADAERRRFHHSRHYKIQEVVKRRQIMLVQVAKEERGNKGAALTTYLSLAGRYCVLMPNTNRGGGVSRKITSLTDRRRLKAIVEDLEIPEGMGVIVRTAGAERSKAEIKRDYEYLLRLWNEIRDMTLQSTAPALIYEEGNLIKRSIRDLYTRDLEEVLVEGEEGYKTAKAFMRTLMPSHAKRVQPYRDPQIGLFHRFQIESQIDAIHSPVAQLRSGGYVVINQTEALVAIDVNSGRSTRERNIEETALRTNLEAADEIARQLRLRDLAGLIVIDFIDMEEHRNQVAVERRLKEALKNDRARIQVGRISPFGLMEMSRQYLPPRTRGGHVRDLLLALEGAYAAGRTQPGRALAYVGELADRRSLVILMADLLDAPDDLRDRLRQLRSRGHDVVLFHLLDPDEVELPYDDLTHFEGMEPDDERRLLCDPRDLAVSFRRESLALRERWRLACLEARVEYIFATTDLPPAHVLRSFLFGRQRARR